MLPLSLAAAYPTFLTHEPTQEDKSIDWAARDTEIMQKDRAFYLSCIHSIATTRGGLAEEYYQLLAREDEINKYWWYVAASQKYTHGYGGVQLDAASAIHLRCTDSSTSLRVLRGSNTSSSMHIFVSYDLT